MYCASQDISVSTNLNADTKHKTQSACSSAASWRARIYACDSVPKQTHKGETVLKASSYCVLLLLILLILPPPLLLLLLLIFYCGQTQRRDRFRRPRLTTCSGNFASIAWTENMLIRNENHNFTSTVWLISQGFAFVWRKNHHICKYLIQNWRKSK